MTDYCIGCSGWYYDHWVGPFYPEGLPRGEWLKVYSDKFNSVEVNSTFYHLPSENVVKGWRKRTPDDFKISLKMNRIVTHEQRFRNTGEMIERFYELADILGEKLGAVLVQLHPEEELDLEMLKKIGEKLDTEKENFIEFRHPSWYVPEAYDCLKELGLGFCIVSTPDLPEKVLKTTENAFVRFHGTDKWYDYEYKKEELKNWAEKIKKLKAKRVYAYFNNDAKARAPKNCEQLKRLLK